MTSSLSVFLDKKFKPLIFELDEEMRIQNWSGNCTHYGWLDETLTHQNITDILPCLFGIEPDKDIELPYINLDNEVVCDIFVHWENNKASIFIVDTTAQKSSQEEVQQLTHNVSLLNANLKRMGKKLEEKNQLLTEANRAKSDFIAGMSHEFRTPITSILGYATWLKEHGLEEQESTQHLKTIERNATYLLTLVENLLQHGRGSRNAINIELQPDALFETLHAIQDTVEPLIAAKGLVANNNIDIRQDIWCLFDSQHLQQILLNLLTNAIKFTDHGEICFKASYEGSEFIAEVQDTGIGIPEADLKNVLTAFKRAANSKGRHGSGLGLSITDEIVRAMGGKMEVTSEEGKGTRVLVQLPMTQTAAPNNKDKNTSDVIPASTEQVGPVLVIDDDPDISAYCELFLSEANIDVHTLAVPAKFAAKIERLQPKLIIIDNNLGDITGLDIIKASRASGYTGHIIMLTAAANQTLRNTALDLGCNDFFNKPIDINKLVHVIRSNLEKK